MPLTHQHNHHWLNHVNRNTPLSSPLHWTSPGNIQGFQMGSTCRVERIWAKWPKTPWKLQNQHFWGKTTSIFVTACKRLRRSFPPLGLCKEILDSPYLLFPFRNTRNKRTKSWTFPMSSVLWVTSGTTKMMLINIVHAYLCLSLPWMLKIILCILWNF